MRFVALTAFAASTLMAAFAPPAAAGKLTVLYAFTGGSDGAYPNGLVMANGLLYGTSNANAENQCVNDVCGTLFSVDPATGTEANLYTFSDGKNQPYAPSNLIYKSGLLYGAAAFGIGSCNGSGCGAIFSVDPTTGKEQTVYAFKNSNLDRPRNLALHGNTLYTTAFLNSETVFDSYAVSINASSGREKVVADLGAAGVYGITSVVSLGFSGKDAFGTSSVAGANITGAVFQLNLATDSATDIHDFGPQNTADGMFPNGNIVVTKDTVYGATSEGGTPGQQGDGTIYKIDRATNTETIMHAFTGPDGSYPIGGLTLMNGKLYGAAAQGGGHCSCGTIFRLDPATGVFTVLRVLKPAEGAHPEAPLVADKGILYGTRFSSAPNTCGKDGCGEVFSFKP
jgi:uncharacterized repeat protein (TIGR03803 family)